MVSHHRGIVCTRRLLLRLKVPKLPLRAAERNARKPAIWPKLAYPPIVCHRTARTTSTGCRFVVIACCVRDDGGSEVSQPPSLPQPSTSTGPNDSEPGTTEAELGARADSTRARCDVKSIKTAGEKKIIWTFWHAKMPPLRVQQMIESWKERAPTWQVCQTYLWDNVGETRHFGPSARTRGVDIATVGTTGFLSYTQNPDYFLNNCRPPDPDYEGGVDTTRAVTVWRGGGGRT